MKILAISDKESDALYNNISLQQYKDVDIIVSCGDLSASYLEYIVTILNKPLLYVPGNHDTNYELSPPQGCINIDFDYIKIKGIKFFGIGGSRRYKDGSYQYSDLQMTINIIKHFPKILKSDVIIAHSPPLGLGDRDSFVHKGFKIFIKIIDIIKPMYFIHGHNHLNYGRDKRIHFYQTTQVINAYEYYILEFNN
jgi:Icc-related predicted phosphoesterase